MHKDTDLAYAAGVIDSDGCVTVGRHKTTKGSYTYALQVQVQMKCEDVPLWFAATFGGHVGLYKKSDPKFPPMWGWRLCCRKAADFLEKVSPFLKLKRVRAEAAIALARSARTRGGGLGYRYGQAPLTIEELARRDELAAIVRHENQKSNSRVGLTAKSLVQ